MEVCNGNGDGGGGDKASEVEWNMVHYDVQLIGGMVLSQGKIAEMKTGEGKTIVAPLAALLAVIERNQVHVVTVNDYLVQRDRDWVARWLGPRSRSKMWGERMCGRLRDATR